MSISPANPRQRVLWQAPEPRGSSRFCGHFFRWAIALACLLPAVAQDAVPTTQPKAPAGTKQPISNPLEEELKWLKAEWITVRTVNSASKHEQQVADAPSSVTIITDDEIRRFGFRSLAEILGSVRGFYVTYDRNYQYLGTRGFGRPGDYNSRVLVLVDGHRVNDVIFDGAAIGTDSPVPVDLIDRVEVVRGPGSSVYGSSAFFGVINIITRRGADLNGVEVSGSAGSFNTYEGRLSVGKLFANDIEMLLSGSYQNSTGPGKLLIPGSGVAENTDHDGFQSVLGTLAYKDFTLQGSFVTRVKQVPNGSYGTIFNHPDNQTKDERSYLDLKYAHHFEEWDADVQARVHYDHYLFDGIYVYPGSIQPSLAEGDRWGLELQYRQTLWERHAVTVGLDFRDNLRLSQDTFTTPPFAPILSDSRTSQIVSPYLETQWAVRTNLIVHAGARFDQYSTLGGVANPRLALVYHPWQTTNLKLLYGSAFRAPNTYELYYQDLVGKANPALRPEDIATYELVWEQEVAANFNFKVSTYHYAIKNLISQVLDPADGLLVYENREKVRANGLELEFMGWTQGGNRARLSYALQNATDTGTGSRLSNSPRHLGKLHIVVPLHPEKLALGAELLYTSPTDTTIGTRAGGYWLANLNLTSQRIIPNLEVSAGLYNVFDRHYHTVVGDEIGSRLIPQDGRSFRVKLTYRF